MKKAFTLIELLIVIIILGILATITFDVLKNVYQNYIYTKETAKLQARATSALNEIAALFRNRVANSVIVTAYPLKVSETDPNKVDFKAIADLQDGDTKYKALEWIGKDYEAKYGLWDSNQKHIQTGWSGFIDLDKATRTNDNPKEFNVTTLNSNFNYVEIIDRNITANLGEDIDPFENNITTFIFSGYDMAGELDPDLNQSFGWYFDKSKNRVAHSIFAIQSYTEHNDNSVDLNITAISETNNTVLYARYFLVRTAYTLVPLEDNSTGKPDYNLTLYYNYQPWRGDWWNKLHGTTNQEANHTLLLNHVTQFRFKKDTASKLFRIYICVQSSFLDINSTNRLQVCKEKAVF